MRLTFEEVRIKAVRRWTDSDGKRHQETKQFWQTLNPYNRNAVGLCKTRDEIRNELLTERAAWLAKPAEGDAHE